MAGKDGVNLNIKIIRIFLRCEVYVCEDITNDDIYVIKFACHGIVNKRTNFLSEEERTQMAKSINNRLFDGKKYVKQIKSIIYRIEKGTINSKETHNFIRNDSQKTQSNEVNFSNLEEIRFDLNDSANTRLPFK